MDSITERLRSALGERYRIERPLGRGGMAVVYLAEDLRHHRRVAIKVLPPELAAELGAERFLREIETAARLQHPHILPVLDSGSAGGLLYFVMPYAEGESLRDRIGRERQLPVEEALRLAREVADALEYAHRLGVIHRDIKPENILLQGGHAVVSDFGIARALGAAGGLTATGVALGTPAYMSPEQVAGGTLDGRSDLYSLACVLYEALTGQTPFTGVTAESLAHQHLTVEPRPAHELRRSVPAPITRAIARALSKAAADRFASAGEFAQALSAAPEGAGAPRRGARSYALGAAALLVLALLVWGGGRLLPRRAGPAPAQAAPRAWILAAEFEGPADDSSLAVATHDLVCAALDQSGMVATVPSDQIAQALALAGKPPGTRVGAALARELAYRSAVRAVLEGRISRLGSGYSVVARVLDVDSARVVITASETAESEEQLVAAVGRLARRLREGLGERPAAIEASRPLIEAATPSFDAYRKYVEADQRLRDTDPRGATALCREALALDPDFAAAWAALGTAYMNRSQTGGEPEMRDSSRAAFVEALRRPGRLTETRRSLIEGSLARVEGRPSDAIAAYDRVIALDPNNYAALNNRGVILTDLGRYEEALASYRRSATSSPFGATSTSLGNQAWALIALGRHAEARSLAPRLAPGYSSIVASFAAIGAGEWKEVEKLGHALEDDVSVGPDERSFGIFASSLVLVVRGEIGAADRGLERCAESAREGRRTLAPELVRRERAVLAHVSGWPLPPAAPAGPGSIAADISSALWAATRHDTALARRCLSRIRQAPAATVAHHGRWPELLEAAIAAAAGRWEEAERSLRPIARPAVDLGPMPDPSNRVLARWLAAETFEHLGKPDSAAAYYAMALDPLGLSSGMETRGIIFPFAHRKLAILYAQMGRLDDARAHWKVLSETCTQPDPQMKPLIEEARVALERAGALAARR